MHGAEAAAGDGAVIDGAARGAAVIRAEGERGQPGVGGIHICERLTFLRAAQPPEGLCLQAQALGGIKSFRQAAQHLLLLGRGVGIEGVEVLLACRCIQGGFGCDAVIFTVLDEVFRHVCGGLFVPKSFQRGLGG